MQLGSEAELQRRLTLILPTDTVRGVFLNSVLDVVRQLGTEAMVAACLEASGEKKFVDFFNYPIHSLIRMLYAASWQLSGGQGGFEKALWRLGYQAAVSFLSSPVGRAMMLLMGGDPKKVLPAFVTATQATTSGIQCELRWTGPKSGVLFYARDFLPHPYVQGSYQGVFDAAKVRGVQMHVRVTGPDQCEYEVTWE